MSSGSCAPLPGPDCCAAFPAPSTPGPQPWEEARSLFFWLLPLYALGMIVAIQRLRGR